MRLSLQLYTVRDLLSKSVPDTLKALHSTGLQYVEMAGSYDLSAEEWKSLLDENGLTVSGSHEGIDSLESDLESVVSRNKTLGNTSIIVPWLNEDAYANGWKTVAARIEKIAKALQPHGMTLGYHNHAFEFELEDGQPGLDVLYANTDPSLVKAQLDLGWVLQGGQSPAAYIEKYADRLDSVHLKDTKLVGHHEDAVAGQGNQDWPAIFAALEKFGVKSGSVEMDNAPGGVFESVKASIEFFQSNGIK